MTRFRRLLILLIVTAVTFLTPVTFLVPVTSAQQVNGRTLPVHGSIILVNKLNITASGSTDVYTTFPGKHFFFFSVPSLSPSGAVGFRLQMQDPVTLAFVNFCQCLDSNGTVVSPVTSVGGATGIGTLFNLDFGGSWRVVYSLLNGATSAVISIGVSY